MKKSKNSDSGKGYINIPSPGGIKDKFLNNKAIKGCVACILAIALVIAGLFATSAATVYSPWSIEHVPEGAKSPRRIRTYFTYTTSETATTFSVSMKSYIQMSGGTASNKPGPVTLSATGQTSVSKNAGITYKGDAIVHVLDKTFTWNKTTSAAKKTIKCVYAPGSPVWKGPFTASTTITVPALAKYTHTFNGNGATSGSVANIAPYYTKTYAFPSNAYQKTGYYFTGWNTKADGTGTTYQPGATSPAVKGNATYYAKWEKQANVTYHANCPDDNSTKTGLVSDNLLGDDAFSRKSYRLAGWNTKADGSGTSYALNESSPFKDSSPAVDLYAEWERVCVTVSLENDDSVGTITGSISTDWHPDMNREEFEEWLMGRFHGSNSEFESHGKGGIIGWSFDGMTSDDQAIYDWDSFVNAFSDIADDTNISAGEIVLHPIFNPSQVTLVFDANGGEFKSGSINTVIYELDSESYNGFEYKPVDGEYEKPKKDNCRFTGFITDDVASGIDVDKDRFIYPYDDVHSPKNRFTLLATWNEDGSKDINDEDGVFMLTNSKPVPVEMSKVSESGEFVQGSVFDLYKMEKIYTQSYTDIKKRLNQTGDTSWLDENGSIVKTVVSDSNGKVNFGDLDFGSYVIVERVVPEQYKKDNEYGNVWYLDVNDPSDLPDSQFFLASLDSTDSTASNQTEDLKLKNVSIPGITIEKQDNATREPLVGGKFELVRVFDNKSFGTSSANENGQISFSSIPEGVYTLTELESPSSIDGSKSYGSGATWRVEVKKDRTLNISEL